VFVCALVCVFFCLVAAYFLAKIKRYIKIRIINRINQVN